MPALLDGVVAGTVPWQREGYLGYLDRALILVDDHWPYSIAAVAAAVAATVALFYALLRCLGFCGGAGEGSASEKVAEEKEKKEQ